MDGQQPERDAQVTTEQWQRVKEVFEAAIEQSPGERSAFVDQACHGDQLLRNEVSSLLISYEEETSFLETPAAALAAQSLAKEESAALVGQQIGRYQIIRELGRGGMGVVYLAQDTNLGRPVALKLLPTHLTADPDRLRRFEREARAASALNHPNILTIHEIGHLDGLHFIATEFIEGVTLREQMKNQGLELSKAVNAARQISNALSAAHKVGIVHRDIKPENIMVRPDGYVKVLDFGLAKLTERRVTSTETEQRTHSNVNTDTGVVIGSAGYMSPEQAKGQQVDQRSDIFSFGAVFYEMLTGAMAFRRDSDVDTLHAIIHDEPVGLSGLGEKAPAEVEKVLLRCLKKKPEERYPSGEHLAAALEAAEVPSLSILKPTAPNEISGAKVTGEATHDVGPQTKEVQKGRSTVSPDSLNRRPLFRTVGVFSGLLLIAVGAWYISRLMITRSGPTQIVLTTNPLTTNPGFEGMPSLSPDGNYVAFGSFGAKLDNLDIYVKLIGGDGPPLRLTSDPAVDMCPAWSPDGRWIAFIRDRDDRNEVLLISATGGSERKLASTTHDLAFPLSFPPYLSWSADSKYLVTVDRASPGEAPGLFVLSVATGERRRLITPPAPALWDGHPAVSPDGRMLAFVRSISQGNTDLYVLPLTKDCQPAGEARRLDLPQPWVMSPAWTADGQYIVCEAGPPWAERGRLWRISVSGSEKPMSLASLEEGTYAPTISRQGNRLVYERWAFPVSTPIWRAEITGRDRSRPAVQLVSSSRQESGPEYSPDGSRIVFYSTRSGDSEIWMCDGDGSNPIQLTSLQSNAVNARWFPDGKRIVFDSMIDKQAEIYVIDTDTRVPRRLTYDPSDDGIPSVSHDGKWIYFSSGRTGRGEVWRIPAEGGEAVQLTHKGGAIPLESPDGKVVYYENFSREDPEVWQVPVAGGEETRVLGPTADFQYAVGADGIYFFGPSPLNWYASLINEHRLKFFSFARGTTEQVLEIKGSVGHGLSVSPDGRYVLFTHSNFFEADLMLVENFH